MRQHGCNHAGTRRLAACARLLQGGRQPVHPLGNRHILRQKPAEFRQCTLPPGRTEESRRNTRHTAAHTGMPRGHLISDQCPAFVLLLCRRRRTGRGSRRSLPAGKALGRPETHRQKRRRAGDRAIAAGQRRRSAPAPAAGTRLCRSFGRCGIPAPLARKHRPRTLCHGAGRQRLPHVEPVFSGLATRSVRTGGWPKCG